MKEAMARARHHVIHKSSGNSYHMSAVPTVACDHSVRGTDGCVMCSFCVMCSYCATQSKEAYYVRSIFENFYPQQTCIETVSGGFSVACSTAKAVEWDEEWKAAALAGSSGDQSGRAVKGVHDSATKCF